MDYKHGKAKPGGRKYFTRKSRNAVKGDIILPRSDGTWYWQCPTRRSKRRKFYEKLTNKLFRKNKIGSGGQYKKLFNLKRELD